MSFIGIVVDQVAQTQQATSDVLSRWLTIVGGLVAVLTFLAFVWARGVRPLLRKLDYVQAQMESNGKAKEIGTDGQTLRDVTDSTKEDVQILAGLIENVRSRTEERHGENQAAIADIASKLSEHLDWSAQESARQSQIEQNQRNNVDWALAKFIELQERLEALARNDTRPPRLEPEENE